MVSPLYDLINKSKEKMKMFLVHGGVDTEDREQVRTITEKEENAIIIASYGTFSTGINIKKSSQRHICITKQIKNQKLTKHRSSFKER